MPSGISNHEKGKFKPAVEAGMKNPCAKMALISSPATTKIPDNKTDSEKIVLTGQSSL